MTQPLAYGENEMFENRTLETILLTAILDEIDYIVEVELKYSDETKQKNEVFTILSEI